MNNVDRAEIFNYLLKLGFRPSNSGFGYLLELIEMCTEGENITPLNKSGYVLLSNKHGKSIATIDKSIQNSISAAWMRGDIEYLYNQFGNTVSSDKGKPGNLQFILQAGENIRLSYGRAAVKAEYETR
ncbi:MAG: sporulation initiation factor Spo0A C-terminal domain-containing protein [Clostridia bacterium]|nr:sporulation initiation factor Spo0A C-terminal domain-containing protein [Clostridia bacterium]